MRKLTKAQKEATLRSLEDQFMMTLTAFDDWKGMFITKREAKGASRYCRSVLGAFIALGGDKYEIQTMKEALERMEEEIKTL